MRALDPRLLGYAAAARTFLVVAVLLGVAGVVLVIAQAELLAGVISRALLDGAGLAALTAPLVALAAVLAGRAALGRLGETVAQRAAAAVRSRLRTRLLQHTLRLGPRWLAQRHSGELATLITCGLDELEPYFSRYLPQLVLAGIIPVVVVGWIGAADPLSAAIIAATLPLVPLFMVLVGWQTRAHTERHWQRLSRLGHHFLDVVTGLPTLRAFGRSTAQLRSIARISDEHRRATLGTLRISFLSALVLELVATFSVALVAVSVGLRLVSGGLDLRTALLVLVLAPEAYLPLRALGARFHTSAAGLSAAQRVFAVLETEPQVPGGSRAPPRHPAIRIRGLGVDGRDGPVFDGLDLDLPPGRTVRLTGPSGAGKSTVLAVLLGFVRPDRGTVLVGDGGAGDREMVPLGELDLDAWRTRIAWVPQHPRFSPGTVADAIRLGAPDADHAAVTAAATAAQLDIGLDARIGDGGTGLSTGQLRRVALARALVTGRPVLLLDEPTEGVDRDTAQAIHDALATATAGHTVLLVTHHPPGVSGPGARCVCVSCPAEPVG